MGFKRDNGDYNDCDYSGDDDDEGNDGDDDDAEAVLSSSFD